MARSTALEENQHFINAEGADFDWRERAACKGRTGLVQAAWRVAHGGDSQIGTIVISNDKLIEYALSQCLTCHCQWDCVIFALQTQANSCTYGVDLEELRWLRGKGETAAVAFVEAARTEDVPVQVAIARHRPRTARRLAP